MSVCMYMYIRRPLLVRGHQAVKHIGHAVSCVLCILYLAFASFDSCILYPVCYILCPVFRICQTV